MDEFKVLKLMASIFTPDFAIGDKLSLINFFQELAEARFDGDLNTLPIPQEAPAEIPRMTLISKDQVWKLEVSLERTNFVFHQNRDFSIKAPDEMEFGEVVNEFFTSYKREKGINIQRLAFVTERVAEIEGDRPSQFIVEKFCKKEYLNAPFNRTSRFELHSLKNYEWENFQINSWARIRSVDLLTETKKPVLLVVNDINTLSQEEAPDINFSEKDIDRFFKNVPEHLREILNLYF